MVHIADTGLLIALHDKNASIRKRTRELFNAIEAPLYTCEPVLTEASHMLSPALMSRMVRDGDLEVQFNFQIHVHRIVDLLEKYAPRMDLADACVVSMTESFPDCVVYTVDFEDFNIYRRFGNKPIPCVFLD